MTKTFPAMDAARAEYLAKIRVCTKRAARLLELGVPGIASDELAAAARYAARVADIDAFCAS